MRKWNLDIREDIEKAIYEAVVKYPHLGLLIEQRVKALLNFPPEQWFVIKFEGPYVLFTPEHGQKVRISGEAILATRTVRIFHFSIHE